MKKEEKSRLMRFLDYITSKAFRDVVKNIFITLVVIAAVVMMYFAVLNYGSNKVKESIGVDVLKEMQTGSEMENVPEDFGLSEISTNSFIENEKLKIKISFSTNVNSNSYVRLSGNSKVMNQTQNSLEKNHEFVFEMEEKDYGSLFVYNVVVSNRFLPEEKVIGRVVTISKPMNGKINVG